MTYAPTTSVNDHIVPNGYTGGFIEVSRTSCLQCHGTANRHVRDFQAGRDWYGRVRGSDSVFSFHPFERTSISHNGYALSIQLNQTLIDGGLLVPFDASQHRAPDYGEISTLDR